MRHLLLVRHGESLWNAEGRIQGQSCAGLSSRGHEQADALASGYGPGLRRRLEADAAAVRIVSSDLQRAAETATPLSASLGIPADPDPRLRERGFGRWEGLLHAEVAASEPERYRRWTTGSDVMQEIGAETASELADRVAPTLAALLRRTPRGGVTVAVSHGGSIWHGLHKLLGLQPSSLGPVGNASVAELILLAEDEPPADDDATTGNIREGLDARPGPRPVLASFNDLAHLPQELRTGGFAAGATSDAVPQMR